MAVARVRIHGLVQGVFFRDSCRREAVARGLTGWVRNSDDGCVEALFRGDEDDVAVLCRWCEAGPSDARVTRVEPVDVFEYEPESAPHTFAVR